MLQCPQCEELLITYQRAALDYTEQSVCSLRSAAVNVIWSHRSISNCMNPAGTAKTLANSRSFTSELTNVKFSSPGERGNRTRVRLGDLPGVESRVVLEVALVDAA